MTTTTIRAARLHKTNKPLLIETIELPPPDTDEIQIKIVYAGINFYEAMIIKGSYPNIPSLPATMGGECFGEVVAIGEDVQDFKIGDKVITYAQTGFGTTGTFATYANVRSLYAFRTPLEAAPDQLAALPMSYYSAWLLVHHRVRLEKNMRIMIHSAAGGVGLALIDLLYTSPWEKLTLVGTCTGEEKTMLLRQKGVDHAIDVSTCSWKDAVKQKFPAGLDVIFDSTGAAYLNDNIASLKPNVGQLCLYGASSGTISDPEVVTKIRKRNLTISGFLMWPLIEDRALGEQVFESLFRYLQQDKIHPQIDHIYPLDQVNEAFDRLRSRHSIGKILLQL
jgi:NADPH:quinone reductase-like Zn-dependent oxidoreductase